MADIPKPVPFAFWRSPQGLEPVREWLDELARDDKKVIGRDIAKVQYGWPIGLPVCRPLGEGLWEVPPLCRADGKDVSCSDFKLGR